MQDVDNLIAQLKLTREDHINFIVNGHALQRTREEDNINLSQQFKTLPLDTILYIIGYHELPITRYWTRLYSEKEQLLTGELIKLFFGYFPLHDHSRTAHTIFSSVSYCDSITNSTEKFRLLAYNIIQTKSIVRLENIIWKDIQYQYTSPPAKCEVSLDHLENLSVAGCYSTDVVQYLRVCKHVKSISLHDYEDGLTEIVSNLAKVTDWSISKKYDNKKIAHALSHCINLTQLDLWSTEIDNVLAGVIAKLPRLKSLLMVVGPHELEINPNLTDLSLTVRASVLDHNTVKNIMNLKSLTTLSLDARKNLELQKESLELFASNTTVTTLILVEPSIWISLEPYLSQNHTIRHLYVQQNSDGIIYHSEIDKSIQRLDNSPLLSQLLSLEFPFIESDQSIHIITNNAKNLTYLGLTDCKLSHTCMRMICYELPHLDTLDIDNMLSESIIDADGVIYAFMNPNLTRLDIVTSVITDDIIKYIKNCTSLRILTINSCNCTQDLSSEVVQSLLKMESLRELYFQCDEYDDDILRAIRENKNLESLTMVTTHILPISSCRALYEAAQHITFFGGPCNYKIP